MTIGRGSFLTTFGRLSFLTWLVLVRRITCDLLDRIDLGRMNRGLMRPDSGEGVVAHPCLLRCLSRY